jgi:hypothetical protein
MHVPLLSGDMVVKGGESEVFADKGASILQPPIPVQVLNGR